MVHTIGWVVAVVAAVVAGFVGGVGELNGVQVLAIGVGAGAVAELVGG